MQIEFWGAVGQVTGSCYLLKTATANVLLDCGLIQGRRDDEARNRESFPFPLRDIDAVVLSHAHIDHSGRLPLLGRSGYDGPIYTHHATRALCETLLRDSAYLQEKDAEWANRRRRRKDLPLIEPLYTQADAAAIMSQFRGIEYDTTMQIAPGVRVRLNDAGHILGAAIVELWLQDGVHDRKLVFSGDLGYRDAPVMESPTRIADADLVLMESTYGDRNHRSFADTIDELGDIFGAASAADGNVLIPAFAVGRTQDLLYLMGEHYRAWGLERWRVFLDSPLAIQATEVYARYRHLYGARLFRDRAPVPALANFQATLTPEESMQLNLIESGAIIIAGSGMCSGGRIRHHLKHHLWRRNCHVLIVGYQAEGTLGRRLVDGARYVRLWNEAVRVNATVHTVGGLSAHADQSGLLDWYDGFESRPPVWLVHGEDRARQALAARLHQRFGIEPKLPTFGEAQRLNT